MLKFLILVVAIIGASAQDSYGQQRPMAVRPTMTEQSYGQERPMTVRPTMTEQSYGQQRPTATMPTPVKVAYGQERPMTVRPTMTEQSYGQQRPMTSEPIQAKESYGQSYGQQRPTSVGGSFNPCTEEVMRSSEIQLFANPSNETTYLICTDVGVFMQMPCTPGTVFNQAMKHCLPIGWEAPSCPVGTCLNNADCLIDEFNQARCLCRVGFTGSRCEVNIDDCALGGQQACSSYNGRCVDQINAYYCEFENGAEIGLSWETRIPRPCTFNDLMNQKQFFELESNERNVFLQCTSELEFIVTKCADMLFWHQELRTCTIEQPIQKTGVCLNFPCKNDGECEDLGGSNFQCLCKPGFTGPMCEEEIDFCLNMPCSNGGRCVSYPNGFNCICQDKVVDDSCATGVQNPCNGLSGQYFPHNLDFTKYFSCSVGYGFVKTCPAGLFWSQDSLTCKKMESTNLPQGSMPFTDSYGQQRPMTVRPTMTEQSYGQQRPMTIRPTMTEQSYGQQRPTATMPTPVKVAYGQERPMTVRPTLVKESYGQQRPMATMPTPVKESYGQQRPMATMPTPVRESYGQQRPMATMPTPVRESYGQQRPMAVRPTLVKESYGQERPMTVRPMATMPTPVRESYGQQRPMTVRPMATMPTPVRESYGQQKSSFQATPMKPAYGEKLLKFFRY